MQAGGRKLEENTRMKDVSEDQRRYLVLVLLEKLSLTIENQTYNFIMM